MTATAVDAERGERHERAKVITAGGTLVAAAVWVGVNDRRFHASQLYIDRVGFEEAFRTILTRETILPAETIAYEKRSFERDTGLVTHTLPPGYTAELPDGDKASAGDVIAIIERPITAQESASLILRPAYVAEVYNRHGFDEVRRRWPQASDDALDAALDSLAQADERLARVVELRYFAGLSEMEIASLMERSERSVRRDWQKARMFLLAALQDGGAD